MPIAAENTDLGGIASLANLFLGKSTSGTTSGTTALTGGVTANGTKTVSNNVSPDAVNAVVNSILQGSQGLAAVASGGAKSGLYNSSTNSMMINDLIARASAEGAKLNSTQTVSDNSNTSSAQTNTTNTGTKTVTAPPISPTTAAAGIGGLQVLGLLGQTGIGKKIGGYLGIGGAAKPQVKIGSSNDTSSAPDTTVATRDATGQPVSNNVSVADSIDAGASDVSSNTVDIGSLQQDTPMDYGQGMDTSAFSTDVGGASDLSFDQTALSGVDGLDLSGAFGGSTGDAANAAIDSSVSSDLASSTGTDFASADSGSDFSDLFDFAEGGLVTSDGNESKLSKYVNIAADKAFNSGGDESGDSGSSGDSSVGSNPAGIDFFKKQSNSSVNAPSASSEPSIPVSVHKSIVGRILQLTGNPGAVRKSAAPGYADGGLVKDDTGGTSGVLPDLTNTGLRTSNPAVADVLSAVSGDQLVNSIRARKSTPQQTAAATPTQNTSATPAGTRSPGQVTTPTRGVSVDNGLNSSEGNPSTDGPVGTPGANQGALDSAVGMGIGSVVGGPIGGLAGLAITNGLNGLTGATPNSMSPVSQLVSFVHGLVSPDPMSDAAAAASAANSAPSTSDNNAAVANGIAADTGMDPLDALVGIVDDGLSPLGVSGMDGSGEGGGVGGSGNSAGDGNSGDGGDGSGAGPGGGGDGGGGTASAKTGGKVKGPGTKTSDSIPIRVSNGEYIIKAAAVDHYGKSFFDHINNSVSVRK